MPAVRVAGAGAVVWALAAAPALVGAAAGAAPLAAGAAAGLLGPLLGALVEVPPHAASSRPAASANPAGQRPLNQLALITWAPPYYRVTMNSTMLALANAEQIAFDDRLPRAHVPGE